MNHKILLVEDDARMTELLHRGLTSERYDVHTAYDGELGLQNFTLSEYDLVISDIILPKINGLDLCRKMKYLKPSIPVIMLTALGTTDEKVEGFDAGADDYLVKPFEMRELLARVRALIKRNTAQYSIPTNILSYADLQINLHTKIVSRGQSEVTLTPKEFNLLTYMVLNSERVLSRTEIAQNVWDTHFDTGTNFIDVYINYLRKKIDKDFNDKLIHTKPGMGFILKRED